jgi:hypothetical protein
MCPDERQHARRAPLGAVKVVVRGLQQGFERGKECAMRGFTAQAPPEPCTRAEPGALGGPIEQRRSPSRGAYHCFNFLSIMGVGIISRYVDGAGWMLVNQDVQRFRAFPTKFAAPAPHDRFARIVVDGAQPRALVGLARHGNHAWLAVRAPQGP